MADNAVVTVLPKLLMVFTGGTISMKIVPGRGAVPARGGLELLASVPALATLADVTCEDFDRLPGPHWTPERAMALAGRLEERLATGAFVGAVVTHGTDTLEETAFLLDLVLEASRPVVFTGAMKTADDPVWDGPGNLLAATRAATSPRSAGRGVLVVFDDTIHRARDVRKAHTESFAAFSSDGAGPCGVVDLDGVHYRDGSSRRAAIRTRRVEPEIALVPAALGTDDRFLRHALATGSRGIVLEALGRGNVPPAMLPAVREAVRVGVPVVVTSRCRAGRTAPRYGYEGGGSTLREAGAIFGGDLGAAKARVLLMVLLGAGKGPAEIREAFEGPSGEAC